MSKKVTVEELLAKAKKLAKLAAAYRPFYEGKMQVMPKCFYVLDKAREQLDIPVWHDDQQGTATVILAGLTNVLKVVGKKMDETLISIVGVGSANTRTTIVLMRTGVKPGNL